MIRRGTAALLLALVMLGLGGCGWRGLNSLPLPGSTGNGPGSFTIHVQLPDVGTLEQNSRVQVGDVTVGNVTRIERQAWHALLTIRLNGDVDLPANATATIGQTSLLGSLHIELAPPADVPPQGKLREGSLIALASAGSYPSTEQTLAAISLLLNGGGIGQIQDITESLSTALSGRADDLRSLIEQLDRFTGSVNDQTGDILSATERLNNLVGQLADQRPVLDRALATVPNALAALRQERQQLVDALDQIGKISALAADSVNQTKDALVKELKELGPVLESLANAGPALTRSLGLLPTYPFPKDTISKWARGDYANLTAIIDLTLSRLDASFLTGTRFEGNLTELELQWGRTIGQMPSPATAGNPLVAPYHWDQGP
ncbi:MULTISPECIES: virulence factor Mce family protein [unclassified Mycobacterium]|uniref:virulence factor Mce family protein n=1 Tax=unclassified Mycobacterium TaxID=2642494 RepID=UPI0007EF2E00|nr:MULTISPECIES: virulence factor Mce family protein [Mycobacterium]MDP7703118.1 virulence factor Mce family protein [Mycobacterium sp. TY815]MDP7721610.1 virulence factor Mce family protein [Mycobacterium sp. TY814]OBK58962.1 mammalian cell entry protein [Mycobacterium gordonae]